MVLIIHALGIQIPNACEMSDKKKFYYKAKLRIIIGNARFSILTVAMATFACLKTVLDQY